MPLIEPSSGSPSSSRPGIRAGQERERLLELGARDVRAEAVVHAGAEGERLGVASGRR